MGVGAGALVIPVVLNLLARAYGFAGAANVGVVAPNPLPAPQATLIAALAQGVIGGKLDWKMIGIGALVGVGLILLDTLLGRMHKLRIPPLAVGIGIYLPMSATFAVIVGAIISHWFDRKAGATPDPGRTRRLGTLVASGLIVGESLWGVINAGLIVATSKEAPIGLVPASFAAAPWLGVLGFVGGDRMALPLDAATRSGRGGLTAVSAARSRRRAWGRSPPPSPGTRHRRDADDRRCRTSAGSGSGAPGRAPGHRSR